MKTLKKTTALAVCAALCFALFGCTHYDESAATSSDAILTDLIIETEIETEPLTTAASLDLNEFGGEKILVVYYSADDCIAPVGEYIAERLGCETLVLVTEKEYPSDMAELVDVIADERSRAALPLLKDLPESIAEYDVIILGFPVYAGMAAPAVFSFLESFDVTDKYVIPFCVTTDGDLGDSIQKIDSYGVHCGIINPLALTNETFLSQAEAIDDYLALNGVNPGD